MKGLTTQIAVEGIIQLMVNTGLNKSVISKMILFWAKKPHFLQLNHSFQNQNNSFIPPNSFNL